VKWVICGFFVLCSIGYVLAAFRRRHDRWDLWVLGGLGGYLLFLATVVAIWGRV
jgi:hypothetical protein